MTDAASKWGQTFAAAGADAMEGYDRILVPGLFTPWTQVVLDLVAPKPGERALDVATGTGVVARALAERLGAEGYVRATDLSAGMLAVARAKPALPGAAPIEFAESVAAPLDAETDGFDVITCHHGLQFFPDKAQALREMDRAAAPNGRIVVAVWDRIETIPAFAALQGLVRRFLGDDAASRYLGPFSCSADDLESAAHEASLGDFTVRTMEHPVWFASPEALVDTLPFSGVAADVQAMPAPDRARMREEAAQAFADFVGDDGIVRCGSSAHVLLVNR